ncbi:short-chain dehydrogenase reductase 2a [Tribolium madens]|uniref:short-chain dehydrogenase reductase 2a n=1 Tax=Tribolium madens TaxID=41895 RepID=UPI001CF724AF|nr:short-chain dehydrogenase reductase 2a [Tribolium madens]
MSGIAAPITRLTGKIAIVTASTDGIGFAIAQRLAREGAKVIVSSRKQNNVDEAVSRLKSEGLDVTGLICHVSKADHRKKLFEMAKSLGGLDILVSNAAVNPSAGGVLDCDESTWDKIFEVNVKAAYLLAKEALPLLRERPFGRIIFVSSIGGFHPFDLLGTYSVSKTALLGLTKAAAAQLVRENITVNSIAPGIIKTKFSTAITEPEAAREEALSRIPMNRFGVPHDISGAAAYLASEDSSYMTGETLIVAGGMPSRLLIQMQTLLGVKMTPKNVLILFRTMSSTPLQRLCGRTAVVTASTEGIGFAIAQRFAQEGAKVIISSRKEKNVEAAVAKLKSEGLDVCGLVCHVSNADQRKKLFETAKASGGLDILVSNAAVNPSATAVLDCDEKAWDKVFDVNVKASFLLAKESLPLLRKSGCGRIIFISSIAGFQPLDLIGAYCVSKCAILGLTKTAAAQLAKENITVNCIAPGLVKTKFSQFLVEKEEDKKKVLSMIPMGRMAMPNEIASAAAFLASDDASYMTGETIVIAGGMLSRL